MSNTISTPQVCREQLSNVDDFKVGLLFFQMIQFSTLHEKNLDKGIGGMPI